MITPLACRLEPYPPIIGITLLMVTASEKGSRHQVDDHGGMLPEAGWPSDRTAPGDLELVRRFCNSINRENGADRFATAAGFDQWLEREDRSATHPDHHDLAKIVTFREALHAITVANHQRQLPTEAWAAIVELLAGVTFEVRPSPDGLDLVASSPSPTAALLGDLALICERAHRDGTLRRLKSCVSCAWTVYDASKNRSSRWCSMNVCGGRHNARAYRQRQHAATTDPCWIAR